MKRGRTANEMIIVAFAMTLIRYGHVTCGRLAYDLAGGSFFSMGGRGRKEHFLSFFSFLCLQNGAAIFADYHHYYSLTSNINNNNNNKDLGQGGRDNCVFFICFYLINRLSGLAFYGCFSWGGWEFFGSCYGLG